MTSYLFDQAWQAEHTRLTALESQWDPSTRHHVGRLGIGRGDRCLEVGCGAGGIATWLADTVGPTGDVVATDLDPRFVLDHGRANLEVRRHDVVTDDLESSAYDLVHARAVLMHVTEREKALARMVEATRPGGWVLLEDLDVGGAEMGWFSRHSRPVEHAELGHRVGTGIVALFRHIGADPEYGARLPDALADAGLVDIGAEIHTPIAPGGPDTFFHLTVAQVAPALVSAGVVGAEDVQAYTALLADPAYRGAMVPMVSAWGRRPGVA